MASGDEQPNDRSRFCINPAIDSILRGAQFDRDGHHIGARISVAEMANHLHTSRKTPDSVKNFTHTCNAEVVERYRDLSGLKKDQVTLPPIFNDIVMQGILPPKDRQTLRDSSLACFAYISHQASLNEYDRVTFEKWLSKVKQPWLWRRDRQVIITDFERKWLFKHLVSDRVLDIPYNDIRQISINPAGSFATNSDVSPLNTTEPDYSSADSLPEFFDLRLAMEESQVALTAGAHDALFFATKKQCVARTHQKMDQLISERPEGWFGELCCIDQNDGHRWISPSKEGRDFSEEFFMRLRQYSEYVALMQLADEGKLHLVHTELEVFLQDMLDYWTIAVNFLDNPVERVVVFRERQEAHLNAFRDLLLAAGGVMEEVV